MSCRIRFGVAAVELRHLPTCAMELTVEVIWGARWQNHASVTGEIDGNDAR